MEEWRPDAKKPAALKSDSTEHELAGNKGGVTNNQNSIFTAIMGRNGPKKYK